MKLLLDTHALLWWRAGDPRLGERARVEITAAQNAVWVSAASIWEAVIKVAAGKLRLVDEPEAILADDALAGLGFRPLAILGAHALGAGALPRHHADPFDRMLIAQARIEDLTIVTSDPAFDAYDVAVIDARR